MHRVKHKVVNFTVQQKNLERTNVRTPYDVYAMYVPLNDFFERELSIHELIRGIFSFQSTILSFAIWGIFIKFFSKRAKESKTNAIQDFIY